MSDLNAIAALHDLDLSWKERMPAGVTGPAKYNALASKFAAEATHQFRSEGTFLATPLRGVIIWTTNTAGGVEKKVTQAAEPLILRYDNDRYADYRDRAKALLTIRTNAAQRELTQENLNNPDFMGPDIWTWTQKQWEKELPFLVKLPKEPSKWAFTEDGWKQTSRMILPAASNEAGAMSYSWGAFNMAAQGDVAGYTHEFEPMQNAVAAIDGELTEITQNNTDLDPQEIESLREALIVKHLFKIHTPEADKGEPFYVTTFDMYPQNVGFAAANFQDKAAHERDRSNEGSLIKMATREFDRVRKYGFAGSRQNVPSVAQIDEAVRKLARQEQDPGLNLNAA